MAKVYTREEALNTKQAKELMIISGEIEHTLESKEVEENILNALFETVWVDELETIRGYEFNTFSNYRENMSSDELLELISLI